jgi:DNA-binding CsgD family transcriptional regulator
VRPDVLSEALSMASIARGMTGDQEAARHLLDEAKVVASGLDYPPGKLAVVQARVLSGFFTDDLDAVMSGAAEGVTLARAAGDLYGLEMMLLNSGSAALIAGELSESEPLLTEALQIADRIDDRVAQFYLLAAFGCHAALSGRAGVAARLLGASETARSQVGASSVLFIGAKVDRARQIAAAALGATGFGNEFDAGKALSRDAALRLVLGDGPAGVPAEATGAALLSQREADVASLVADGLTNKQIGARLFISERTVDSHVRSILTKLGARSRAQIAAWIAALDR